MKSARTSLLRIVLACAACMFIPASLFSQLDVKVNRITRVSPNIRVFYSIRCGGTLDMSHTMPQLSLREDGVPVTQFVRQCPDTTIVGDISFALVLDGSGSTVGASNRWIKAGAKVFAEKMQGSDQGAVFTYGSDTKMVQAMTTDSAAVKRATDSLTAAGVSATYDAVYQALNHVGVAGSRSRRAIIAVADSPDNASGYTSADVVALSQQLHIPVILIGVGSSMNPTVFQSLTEMTGGKFYSAVDSVQLSQAFRDAYEYIADSFEECRLVYVSRCGDGAMHTVELSASNVCGGNDMDSKQFREAVDPQGQTELMFANPPYEAVAGQSFVAPVYISTSTAGVVQPFDMLLTYYRACMEFESVTAASGSPLSGVSITATPEGTGIRLRSSGAAAIPAGLSVAFNLNFKALARNDSTVCNYGLENISFSAGCYYPRGMSATVNVSAPPNPEITPGGRITLCPGQSVRLVARKGYDSYLWSTSATDTAIVVNTAGSYTVTAMDRSGRIGTSVPVEVVYKASPVPRLNVASPVTLCKGDSLTLTATKFFPAYQWSTGQSSSSITVTQPGTYFATVTDDIGCTWMTDTLFVTVSDPRVVVAASGPLTFCEGEEVALDAGSGFQAYRWSDNRQGQRIIVRSSGSYTVRVSDANGCSAISDTVRVLVIPRPVAIISPSGNALLCPGDSIVLDAGPGHAAYQWSTGGASRYLVINQPGTYGLIVTNGSGCASLPDSVSVSMLTPPSLNQPDTVVICAARTVNLDAGPGFVSYLWSQGATSRTISVSASGTYFVQTTTASGCTLHSDTVVVVERAPFKPVITPTADQTMCEGDSVVLDGGDYATWSWSNGEATRFITVRTAGNFAVSVTDAYGCSASSDIVRIQVLAKPAPAITAQTQTRICEGDSVLLSATPGFVSYRWSDGSTSRNLAAKTGGSYNVTVTNAAGCAGTSPSIAVTVVPPPAKPVITRNGETLTASSATSYQWIKDGVPMAGVTGQQFVPVVSGSYAVRVFNADGCHSDSDPMSITSAVAATPARPIAVTVHPDPTTGRVTITGDTERGSGVDITIANLLGQVIARSTDRTARGRVNHTLNISSAPNGLYLVQVRIGDRTVVRRIVKQ